MVLNTPNRVNEIDFLRFFAAIAVVFWHYAAYGGLSGHSLMSYPPLIPIASYGFYGVHLFFMISGFVILMTASNGQLQPFIISRITRLYPAFWVCCTITFLVLLMTDAANFKKLLSQYLVNMTMLSGFLNTASLDGSYWSLFVEMQFYAFVACILLLKQIKNAQVFMIIWLLISIALLPYHYSWAHRLFITDYSAYFIAGAGFFLIWKEGLSLTKGAIVLSAYVLGIYKLLTQNGSSYLYVKFSSEHLFTAAIILTVCFMVFCCISLKKTGLLGQYQWLKLGALTYPLYLIHQVVGFKIFNALFADINLHVLFWGTTALMIALSYWISQCIEKPIARQLARSIRQRAIT